MVLNIYTVYDKVAEEAGPLFQAVNDGIALRNYRNMQIPESLKNDYSLHRIGTYDTVSMEIVPEIVYTLNEEAIQ